MPVIITARIKIPPSRTAVLGCAEQSLPQDANQSYRSPPCSTAPSTGTFLTRTTVTSSTSVSRIKPPRTLAPLITFIATRRSRASDRGPARTARSSSVNTQFRLSTSSTPRIPAFMAFAYVTRRLWCSDAGMESSLIPRQRNAALCVRRKVYSQLRATIKSTTNVF